MADIEAGAAAHATPLATPDIPAPADSRPLQCTFRLDTLVAVRHEVEKFARTAGLEDIRLYKFVMAVNEIMTNAVHHGGGVGDLRLWHDGSLRCLVTDRGRGIPADRIEGRHRPEPGSIGGWGLWLARQICDEVRISTGPTGTEVGLRFAVVGPD
jgi:anti-sigma regulatory factor (Ser/Thr protein kinase)